MGGRWGLKGGPRATPHFYCITRRLGSAGREGGSEKNRAAVGFYYCDARVWSQISVNTEHMFCGVMWSWGVLGGPGGVLGGPGGVLEGSWRG